MKMVSASTYYTLYQSVKERCFYMDFGQKMVRISMCQLLALRYKVMSIPIENHFDSDLNKHGFEVLLLCNKEHLFVLNTYEILDLRLFVEHCFATLGLSVKKECTLL